MNPSELLELYDQEERIRVEFPDFRREVLSWGIRHVPTRAAVGLQGGFVSYSRLTADNADQVIGDQIAYYTELAAPFEWKAYTHDTPFDLRDRLAARDFEIDEAEAIMVLDLWDAPAQLLAPVTHDVRRVADPDQIVSVLAVQEEVWQVDHTDLAAYLSHTLRETPDTLAVYAAYAGERLVSSAWLFFRPPSRFASLWGGSTLPGFRKQGFYTALLAVRVQEAIRRGARFLTIDASPMSRPIVEHFGFQFITTAYACNWRPPGGVGDLPR